LAKEQQSSADTNEAVVTIGSTAAAATAGIAAVVVDKTKLQSLFEFFSCQKCKQ
jgi:hypothetical protein